MTLLTILWFILIAVLIAGYFVLDGFDLGAGVLYPFLAEDEAERAIVRRSIGPVWDGNEVWLLTAGGALFAAFPAAYATTFSGFYLAIMLVLFGLIVRAISLEYRAHDEKWARVWDVCFFIGSLLPALLLGVAVGNVVAGIPMDANGDYAGMPLFGLITPFTLACGVMGLTMFLAAGAAWIALKSPEGSKIHLKAKRLRLVMQVAALVVFVLFSAFTLLGISPQMAPELAVARYLFAGLFVVAVVTALLKGENDLVSFLAQSLGAVCLVGLLASTLFPNLVVASPGSIGASITAASAASSELTLFWMTIIACIGVPLVLLYHVIVYRMFRGRLSEEDLSY